MSAGEHRGMGPAHRVWRLRKLHQQAEAIVRSLEDGVSAQLQLFYNGTLTVGRTHPTIESAWEEAAARRAELEREGWTFHW